MDILAPVGVIALCAMIHASLQLNLGGLWLVFHAAATKNTVKKTRKIARGFVVGVAMMTFLMLAVICFVAGRIAIAEYAEVLWCAAAGMAIALMLMTWIFYYRRGETTELWISKRTADFEMKRAKKISCQAEAISLGMLNGIMEWPFEVFLMLVAAGGILMLPESWQLIATIIYMVIVILPMVIMLIKLRRYNLAEVQRWRVKNKTFNWAMIGLGFLALAAFIIGFLVI